MKDDREAKDVFVGKIADGVAKVVHLTTDHVLGMVDVYEKLGALGKHFQLTPLAEREL